MPRTGNAAPATATSSGRPTYPRPTTATVAVPSAIAAASRASGSSIETTRSCEATDVAAGAARGRMDSIDLSDREFGLQELRKAVHLGRAVDRSGGRVDQRGTARPTERRRRSVREVRVVSHGPERAERG